MAGQDGISAEELKILLERYCIGKKPLAALLGWGATTILRYADGVVPAGEYGSHLKKLYQEPLYYLEVLEENKERLTPVAYKKSKKAVLACLTASKLWCAVQYVIGRSEQDISPFRVVMTLYYAQAFSLGLTDSALFWEECTLSPKGELPYGEYYEQVKLHGTQYCFVEESLLTKEEERFLDAAYDVLLWYGPAELRLMFQTERRYIRVSRTENGGKKIKNAALAGYFRKVVQGYKIIKPEEFHLYFADRTGRGRKR